MIRTDTKSWPSLHQIRLDISNAPTAAARAALLKQMKDATLGNPQVTKLLGTEQLAAFAKVLASTASACVFDEKGALAKPSSLRSQIIGFLAGEPPDTYWHAPFQGRELASRVGDSERKLVIAQLEEAVAGFDKAMRKLPPREFNKSIAGRYDKEMAADVKDILVQTLVRLRQPAVAKAMDDFGQVGDNPIFPHEYDHSSGVSPKAFANVVKVSIAAVRSGQLNAPSDVRELWQSTKTFMAASSGKTFSRLTYYEGGDAFTKDRIAFEDTLKTLAMFNSYSRPSK